MGCDSTNYDECGRETTCRQGIEKTLLWKQLSGCPQKGKVRQKSSFSYDVTEFLYLLSKRDVHFLKEKKCEFYYIGIDELIKNKKAVNRNKDMDDMRFLKEVKKRTHH